MESDPANDEKPEKPENNDTPGGEAVKKPEKEISKGEPLPGWTIMRPLRKRGNKSSAATKNDASANGDATRSVDSKNDVDLKVTETNSSDDRVGEIEALQDVRSDDELLGDEDEAHARATRAAGDPGDHTLQNNDGTAEEQVVNNETEYKVYKRRWFGLVQLVLLNIIVSWDVSVLNLDIASHCVV